ncbi:MAG: hypothetical protein KA224_06505 [Steroidobacteraceae bacterium]|nr:hypothetical protein [Steroidobacteraceae bacterium]
MSWKLRVLVPALLLAPQAAMALGLGDIRLNSSLNEPLAAEIDLVAATPEEVSALQAKLASRDLFQRYGLDRPQFLDSLQFRVGKGRDGRSVLIVRSTAAITEPFVTFLVEASWSSGRLLREYTLLLDPPVYAPGELAKGAAVSAPVVSAPAAPRAPTAPAPVSGEPVAAPPPVTPASVARPGTVTVRRNDTLAGIAHQLAPSRGETNQMIVALYRANPQAFSGNINRLKAGAELRVPEASTVASIAAREAAREIAEQTAAWRESAGTAEARLRLVPPEEGAAAAPAPAPGPAAAASSGEVARLQQELAEARRLLELKNQELATLQQSAAASAAAGAPAEAPAEAAIAPEDDTGAAPATDEPAPAAAEPAKPPKKQPPKPSAEAETSFVDEITSRWQWLLGAAALVLGGLVTAGFLRRRREAEEAELEAFTSPTLSPPPPPSDDATRIKPYTPAARSGVVVEEQAAPAPRVTTSGASFGGRMGSGDDTISEEGPANLDQTDPLAEADFHMAYGLYDQAADLMRLAIEREPSRRDYKVKLLEIFFVWGNKQGFLDTARDLDKTRSAGPVGEWERIAIMGRQMSPNDPMFAATAGAAATSRDVMDLDLGAATESNLDLNVPAPSASLAMDLDLGTGTSADSTAATGRNSAIEFDLDVGASTATAADFATGDTNEMPMGSVQEPTVRQPRLESHPSSSDVTAELPAGDLGIDLAELEALANSAAGDTVEQPRPDVGATAQLPALDATSQLESMDFDLGTLSADLAKSIKDDATSILDMSGQAEDTQATQRLSFEELASSDLEPVTMSEVGTKLDLARAYVDMGDPDGARSILQEVLAEGTNSQKAEAQRLLDGLPGA